MVCELPRSPDAASAARQISKAEVPDAAARSSMGLGWRLIVRNQRFHAIPRLHLLVSIDKKVIEILDANQAEPRILHVRNSVEGNR